MDDIFKVIEITSNGNEEVVNEYLADGWKLLHVGQTVEDSYKDQLLYTSI